MNLYNYIYNIPAREKALQGLSLKIIANRMTQNKTEEEKAHILYNKIINMTDEEYLKYKEKYNNAH